MLFLSLCVYSFVSFTEFMVAAEKESCLSCWLSVVGLVAQKLVIAFPERVHILISIGAKHDPKQTNKQKQTQNENHNKSVRLRFSVQRQFRAQGSIQLRRSLRSL